MLPWGGGENLDSAQGKRVDININNNYTILALDGVAHWLDCQLVLPKGHRFDPWVRLGLMQEATSLCVSLTLMSRPAPSTLSKNQRENILE